MEFIVSENKIDVAMSGKEQEEEDEEESPPPLLCYVPCIHNGFLLDHLFKYGNAATADMLLDLPLYPHTLFSHLLCDCTPCFVR